MVIPRSWAAIEKQRDPEQARLHAQPVATDARFKAAAFFLFCAWLTTAYSIQHSIKHYKPRQCGRLNRVRGLVEYTPTKFVLTLLLSLVMIGYEAAIAFNFSISPLNVDPNLPVVYLVGWLPIALIFVVYEIAGYLDPNEDRELIRQRRIRGAEADHDMGITMKPHWWSRLHDNNQPVNVHDAIARNVGEIRGGTATDKSLKSDIEMGNMPATKLSAGVDTHTTTLRTRSDDPEAGRLAVSMLFRSQNVAGIRFSDAPITGLGRTNNGLNTGQPIDGPGDYSHRRNSMDSGTTLGTSSQQIRSMLDV
jgi:hypothetical protein